MASTRGNAFLLETLAQSTTSAGLGAAALRSGPSPSLQGPQNSFALIQARESQELSAILNQGHCGTPVSLFGVSPPVRPCAPAPGMCWANPFRQQQELKNGFASHANLQVQRQALRELETTGGSPFLRGDLVVGSPPFFGEAGAAGNSSSGGAAPSPMEGLEQCTGPHAPRHAQAAPSALPLGCGPSGAQQQQQQQQHAPHAWAFGSSQQQQQQQQHQHTTHASAFGSSSQQQQQVVVGFAQPAPFAAPPVAPFVPPPAYAGAGMASGFGVGTVGVSATSAACGSTGGSCAPQAQAPVSRVSPFQCHVRYFL